MALLKLGIIYSGIDDTHCSCHMIWAENRKTAFPFGVVLASYTRRPNATLSFAYVHV